MRHVRNSACQGGHPRCPEKFKLMQALRDVAPALLKEEPDEVVWRANGASNMLLSARCFDWV
jgi:hypothetical protein